jgi:acetyl esterase/lipase
MTRLCRQLTLFLFGMLAPALLPALPPAETHVFKVVGDLPIMADVYRVTSHDGPRPVMVYMHGGSLINGGRESVEKWTPAHTLHAAGVVIVSIDYRLAPETKLAALVEDVEDAFRWVREDGPALFNADPARVGSSGGSAGGYLTLVTGHRVKPAPVVILAEMSYCDLLGDWQMRPSIHPPHYDDSNLCEAEAWKQVSGPPIANVGDRKGDGSAFNDFIRRNARWPKAVSGWDPVTEAEKYTPYLPLRNVTEDFPPTFMIHGEVDTDVPFSQPQAMAAELARHDVPHRLVGIPNGEHGYRGADLAAVSAARREAVEFALARLIPESRVAALPPVQTFTYKRVGDLEIKADVNLANCVARPTPVVVWIHGGGLMGGERRRESVDERALIDLLLAGGITVVSIDYRLAPETKLPAIVEDVEDALRWVREEGPELFAADPERIGVVGTSAGGFLTLTAGFRVKPRVRALVSFWGYGEIIGPWYGSPSTQPRHNTIRVSEAEARLHVSGPPVANGADRAGPHNAFYQFCRQHGLWPREVSGWDPHTESEKFTPYMALKNVAPDYPPTFLVHGENDTDVPFEQSAIMAAELARHGVEHRLLAVPGAEHGLKGSDPALLASIEQEAATFLQHHLFPDRLTGL